MAGISINGQVDGHSIGHRSGLVEGYPRFEPDVNDRRTGLAKIQPLGNRMSVPIIGLLILCEDHKEMPSAGECWGMLGNDIWSVNVEYIAQVT